jgi:signal transduction histidine kinase
MISLSALAAKTPRVRSHTRVHIVYFILASFDILAVGAGLLLSNHFAGLFERTVEYRQQWDKTLTKMWEINDLVMEMSAPVVHVFETGDPVGKSRKFEENLSAVKRAVISLQHELINSDQAEAAQDALAALHVVNSTLKLTAEHGRSAFSQYYNGWIDKAAHCMSMTQGFATKLKHQFHGAMASIMVLTRNYETSSVQEMQKLKNFEGLIGLFILVMVACVTIYGHYIGKVMKQKHEHIAEANRRLEASRADTLAFAARLQTVNDDVTRLNHELTSNMKLLEDAQEQNIRKGKLAQLGQLTATVAHEIRNPLNTIRTAAYLISRKLGSNGSELEVQIERINKGVIRCDNIISELLDFTRSQALQAETVNVDDWLEDVVREQAQKLPQIVKVEFKAGLEGMSAAFDTSRMYRVVVNFLSNASEAMVGRGDEPNKFSTSAPRIVISSRMGTRGIEIACADNGPGMTEETLKKVREPLFTTKSYGVGLGIPAIEKILDEHGGGLRIDTKLGEGTIMTAWFPSNLDKREAA